MKFSLLFFFLVLLPLVQSYEIPGAPATKWLFLFLVSAVFATRWFFTLLNKKQALPWGIWLVFTLLFLQISASFININPGYSLHNTGFTAAALVLALTVLWSPIKPQKVALAATLAVIPIILISLLAVLWRINLMQSFDFLGSTLYARNDVSSFLVQCIPLILLFSTAFFRSSKKYSQLLITLLLASSLWVIFQYRTRSAWLVVMIYVIYFVIHLIFVKDKRIQALGRRFLLAVSIAIIGFLIVPTQLSWTDSHPYAKSLKSIFSSSSGDGRLTLWRVALNLTREHPLFGIGPGRFSGEIWGALRHMRIPAHEIAIVAHRNCFNEYLQKAAEGGVLSGILLIIIGIIIPLFLLWKSRANGPRPLLSVQLLALSSLSVGINAMMDLSFQHSVDLAYFSVCLALSSKYLLSKNKSLFVGTRQNYILKPFLAMCAVLLSGLFILEGLNHGLTIVGLSRDKPTLVLAGYSIWPFDEVVLSPEIVSKVMTKEEVSEFLENRKKFWPQSPLTDYSEAIIDERSGDVDSAFLAYRKAIFPVIGGQCFYSAFSRYMDWITKMNLQKNLRALNPEEVKICLDQ